MSPSPFQNRNLSSFVANFRCCCIWVAISCFAIELGTAQDSTERYLSEFSIHPDCDVQLVAVEPAVVDPIAVRFDEHGRMWVVEMRDYPTLKGNKPNSKIKVLEDLNADGFFETVTIFADQLLFPTGLQPWKNGVIVTMEGKICYLADNDGDLVCDEEQVLFRGFAKQNTQLRANHPMLGIDGKIYVANGLRNGMISSPQLSVPISISGMDFRFDPLSLACTSVTGYGQFGLTFDDAGNRYTCTNRNPLKRIVFENEYLEIAKSIPIAPAVVDVAAAGSDSRLFPLSETWTTSNLHANQFTAACGVHFFFGNALSKEFMGNAFVCDPTANLVHREVIDFTANDITGTGVPARTGVEFLASTNPAFRPVNLTTGPDGALYVVDMRREVIEHPDFMPNELKKWPDERRGGDLGRIYRIKSKTHRGERVAEDSKKRTRLFEKALIQQATDGVYLMLVSANSWDRETAHRLLLQNELKPNVDLLRQLLKNENIPANSVIRILNLLKSFNHLNRNDLETAADRDDSRVEKTVVFFAETLGDQKRILDSFGSESQRVRFQALLSAAKLGMQVKTERLVEFAVEENQNRYMRSAILLAAKNSHSQLLNSVLDRITGDSELSIEQSSGLDQLCFDLADSVSSTATLEEACKIVSKCLGHLVQPVQNSRDYKRFAAISSSVAVRFLSAVKRRGKLNRMKIMLSENRPDSIAVEKVSKSFSKEPSKTKLALHALLSADHATLFEMTRDISNPELQLLAIEACHLVDDDSVWINMVDWFRGLNSRIRAEVLRAAVQRSSVALKLIEMVRFNKIKVHELDATTRKSLVLSKNAEVRSLAQKHLVIKVSSDRNAALKKFLPAIEMETNAQLGKRIFEKTCASCHQLGDLGNQIGPDISDTRTKTKSQLLRDIMIPNAAIDSNYIEYQIENHNGKIFSGIIIEENVAAVMIRQANNSVVKINRDDILQFASTGKSLMPVGLEDGLGIQEVADLLSFLKNWRYLDQNIPFKESDNAK